jgi:hypothetical protein
MAEKTRTAEQIKSDLEAQRNELAAAVNDLRGELGAAANISGKLKAKLPVVATGAASVGFVLAGGVGATMRYFARRGREGNEKVRLGRWSILDRD